MKKTVEEKKKEQGWIKKPACCRSCKFFTSKLVKGKNYIGLPYETETNLRCTIGNFKVGKMNWCTKYERREND